MTKKFSWVIGIFAIIIVAALLGYASAKPGVEWEKSDEGKIYRELKRVGIKAPWGTLVVTEKGRLILLKNEEYFGKGNISGEKFVFNGKEYFPPAVSGGDLKQRLALIKKLQ